LICSSNLIAGDHNNKVLKKTGIASHYKNSIALDKVHTCIKKTRIKIKSKTMKSNMQYNPVYLLLKGNKVFHFNQLI